jgi:hypothetical protein
VCVCLIVCDLETSIMRGSTTELGCIAAESKKRIIYIDIWITEYVYNKILVYHDSVLDFIK